MEKDRNIEDFFKKAFEGYQKDISFNEDHWFDMAKRLDKEMPVLNPPANPYYYGSNLLSIIAGAILLLGVVSNYNDQKQLRQIAARRSDMTVLPESSDSKMTGLASEPGNLEGTLENTTSARSDDPLVQDGEMPLEVLNRSDKEFTAKNSERSSSDTNSTLLVLSETPANESREDTSQKTIQVDKSNENSRLSTSEAGDFRELQGKGWVYIPDEVLMPGEIATHDYLGQQAALETVVKDKPEYPKFAVAFAVSPDFSSNQLGNYNRFGSEIGLVFEYRFAPRLSLEVGGLLTSKRYSVDADAYETPMGFWREMTGGQSPSAVDARCRVIDVPINLRYRILENDLSSISASAGLSSYFMLQEDYDFQMPGWVWFWGIENENRHYLGTANLQVYYERKLSRYFSIEASPFVKLPLTGYGHGNIKFHSLGAFLSLKRYFGFGK